jgi:hypothetical protein
MAVFGWESRTTLRGDWLAEHSLSARAPPPPRFIGHSTCTSRIEAETPRNARLREFDHLLHGVRRNE